MDATGVGGKIAVVFLPVGCCVPEASGPFYIARGLIR